MKNKQPVFIACLLASLSAAHAQFTAGNIVVLQDGTGSAALTSAGTALFLDQFTTTGTFVNDVAIPTTGATALVNSGTATSEGSLSLSADGQDLVLAGYNTSAGTASVAGTTSSAVPRALATVDASGNYSLAASTSTAFSANNVRSGTTDGSGNFWAIGANTGVVYLGTGTPGTVSATSVNNRVLQNIGGNLYFSTGSGSTRGIYKITGNPTSGTSTAVNMINTSTLGSVSPFGFAFNANLTIAYIADSDAFTTSSGFGGVEKWSFNGTSWAFDYSLSLGTDGATGVAVNFSGANPVIYATSSDGTSIFDIVDTGSTATGTLLDTAGANTAFRGLEFAPTVVPEPSTLALAGLGLSTLFGLRRLRNRKA